MSKATKGFACPTCGSVNLNLAGKRKIASKIGKVQQYYCCDCGHVTRKPKMISIYSEAVA